MPVTPTYPGVYIEEVPSGVRTITGVSTSVAAFIGYFKKGPMNEAIQIFNMGDFERIFSGLDTRSEASYAIQQFFLNGGQDAWVVRTASGNVRKAAVEISDTAGPSATSDLTVEAKNAGEWGNNLRMNIDYNTSDPARLFNLTIAEVIEGGRVVQSEMFRNLSMDSADQRYIKTIINDKTSGSKLIHVADTVGTNLPLQNGTVSGKLPPSITFRNTDKPAVNVSIGNEGTATAKLCKGIQQTSYTLQQVRSLLETAIRSSKPDNPAFASARVEFVRYSLRTLAGPTEAGSCITFSAVGSDPTVSELKLDEQCSTHIKVAMSGEFPDPDNVVLKSGTPTFKVIIGSAEHTVTLTKNQISLTEVCNELDNSLHQTFSEAKVVVYENRLIIASGSTDEILFQATNEDQTTVDELNLKDAINYEGVISGVIFQTPSPFPSLSSESPAVNITIGSEGPLKIILASIPDSMITACNELQNAIRRASQSSGFTGVKVAVYNNQLIIIAGAPDNIIRFSEAADDNTTVTDLKLDDAQATNNVQEYQLGGGAIEGTGQVSARAGDDGDPPDASALIGSLNEKTGIYALEDVNLFNILCIPRTAIVSDDSLSKMDESEAFTVMVVANNYCGERRAFFVMDPPDNIEDVQGIKDWLEGKSTLRHKNSAIYFPRIRCADPLNEFRLRSFGPSGTIAGLYARTDSTRGVWKAPAGTGATLANVQGLGYTLTDQQNGTLNPQGINCLRSLPVYGNICWGARTLQGADQIASEWKYIPIRRTALFIEESLYRGSKWAVFEPNDEPLWDQLRLNIRSFMMNLFRKGAFQGSTPADAFFVKCDKETTTQNDINLGIVNILVGFAPLKPAEFVILKISQKAGQSVA